MTLSSRSSTVPSSCAYAGAATSAPARTSPPPTSGSLHGFLQVLQVDASVGRLARCRRRALRTGTSQPRCPPVRSRTLRRGVSPVDLVFRPCFVGCGGPDGPASVARPRTRRTARDAPHRPGPARRPRRRHRRQRRPHPRRVARPPTQGADLVVFTELTITGYPPEDLLLKREFVPPTSPRSTAWPPRVRRDGGGRRLRRRGRGRPRHEDPTRSRALGRRAGDAADLTNSAAVLADGEVVATYDKLRLPNYGVFDEARYFTPTTRPASSRSPGARRVTVCEDLWTEDGPGAGVRRAGAR
jgi:hypothetical protein